MEHGEKSLDIDFGDSDEEEIEVVREEGDQQNSRRSSGAASGGIMAELTDAMEEEEGDVYRQGRSVGSGRRERRENLDDDEFCLLDAPTSTYVVR